ncbi:MAG: hypothetical protein AAGK47_09330 [Bacteroidota bacterium]
MYKLLFALGLLCCLYACGEDNTSSATTPETTPTTQTTPTQTQQANMPMGGTPLYPAMSSEKATRLFRMTDYMDYVFYDLPFSMSHDKEADIKNAISYIGAIPTTTAMPQCPSIGRIFYQSKGEIIGEAEFHFNSESRCHYLVFLEDGKPKYSNLLTEIGVRNYTDIFAKVNNR